MIISKWYLKMSLMFIYSFPPTIISPSSSCEGKMSKVHLNALETWKSVYDFCFVSQRLPMTSSSLHTFSHSIRLVHVLNEKDWTAAMNEKHKHTIVEGVGIYIFVHSGMHWKSNGILILPFLLPFLQKRLFHTQALQFRREPSLE